ncbi:MAG: zinc ribbon domain-containing protein [Micrococcales bacterium]|nr:zinc ribbon domain-containing protein [Micrococcales bacterium]
MSGRTCPACGHEDNAGKFCVACGSAIDVAAETPSSPAPAGADAQPGVAYPATSPLGSPAPAGPRSTTPHASAAPAAYPAVAPQPTGQISLLPGERLERDVQFTPHLILQHLKTRVVLTDRRAIVQHPQTIFGIIPLGYYLSSAPWDAIDGISYGTRVRTRYVVAGAILVLWGLLTLATGGIMSALGGYGGYYGGGISGASVLFMLLLWAIAAYLFFKARVVGIFVDAGIAPMVAAARGGELGRVEEAGQDAIRLLDEVRGTR